MNIQESTQPVRPPRMTRSLSKESSTGLLMSVIRSLTASRDTVERDIEKANLQRQFRESDNRLDKLVLDHHADLTSVMQAFSKISQRLHFSKDRLQTVREKLVLCQKLLDCKRDELKRLWIESVENKHTLQILNQVETMTKVPNEIRNYMNKSQYVDAIQLILKSLVILEEDLKSVDALSEVKAELNTKKEEIIQLVEDQHKHAYINKISTDAEKTESLSENEDNNAIDIGEPSLTDLNSYFLRKRTGLGGVTGNSDKIKKFPLFKFDSSSHAISLNAYLKEQKDATREKTDIVAETLDPVDVEKILNLLGKPSQTSENCNDVSL